MSRPDLVIFDCDGVLIDSEVISARMLVAELAQRGIEVDTGYVVRNFLGRSYPIVLDQIRVDFGISLPEGFEADYRARLLTAFGAELQPMEGITEVLDALAVPYCLATSSSGERLRFSLEHTGLASYFEGRCSTASEVAHGKPAPDLFLHAAEKMGVSPQRCLVIEDSLAGVRAGLAAGMRVWQFIGGSHLRRIEPPQAPDAEPHRRFDRFAEFFDGAPGLRREAGT